MRSTLNFTGEKFPKIMPGSIRTLFIPIVLSFILSACAGTVPRDEVVDSTRVEEEVIEEIPTRYGIPENAYKIHEGRIERNQFLADILLGHNVPYEKIAGLADVSKDVFDVRRLRAGDPYTVFCSKDSVGAACYFVVETSPSKYVVYGLEDSLTAYLGEKPVEYRIREASGRINSSLYQTLADNDLHTSLAVKLADMYAWTVDFYRIQAGDYFKVIYEESYIDGNPVGIGNVLAAEFGHRNDSIFAFRFEGGEHAEYYDRDGENLRKAFLQAPVKFSRISSRYTKRRFHPVQKRWKAHLGTDYAAPTGTPIQSTADGVVIASAYGNANGNYVKIKHNSTYTTQYLHMSKRAVKKGDRVRQGDVIGYVGSTGLATGPHVCYRFWKNGSQVDPYHQDLPSGDPVPDDLKADFFKLRDSLYQRLNQIGLMEELAMNPPAEAMNHVR